jgi:enediyne biosynthesis protein E4
LRTAPATGSLLALAGLLFSGVLAPVQPGAAPAPLPDIRFENTASAAGIDFKHTNGASADRHLAEIMGSGGLFFDYDNDGWVDVFLVDGGSIADTALAARARHRLYRNRGSGRFEDVTAKAGIEHGRVYGMGACAADYDNDGWIDLVITGVGANALYRNNGNGTFTDVTAKAGIGPGSFGASCALADVDRDGFVDLFVTNYVDARVDNNAFCGMPTSNTRMYCHPLNYAPLASVLYHNNGNGTFADVSTKAGIAGRRGSGLGVVIGDYDDDGWPDIVVANDSMPNFLYHNEGRGAFKEIALEAGIAVASDGNPRAGMGIDLADYDGDGRADLFITNHELEAHTLFRNLGRGLFADMTSQTGVALETLPYVGFGTTFLDYDNDGDLDLAIANGHVLDNSGHYRPGSKMEQRKLLFRNDGRRFKEVGRLAGPGFAIEKIGRGLAAADIDNDGDLDLLFTNNGDTADLLRNMADHGSNANNALLVRLVGTRSNRSAVGARLVLTAGPVTQVREVKAGSSYLAQNDLRQHFGLGRAAQVDRLEIRWPSGQTDALTNIASNQIVTVTEGKGVTGRSPFAR